MFTARKKIQKENGSEPTELEDTVAQAFFDLENANHELKSDLKDLYFNSAAQMDVAANRKALVIHVPYRLRKAYKKIHVRLVRELEKKFSGKDVVLIATRRILRPPKKGSAVVRPRSRTLTAVHEGILEDIVYPAEIVGKRVRYRLDGAKVMKIFLDPRERNNTEYKLESFTGVYRKICGKEWSSTILELRTCRVFAASLVRLLKNNFVESFNFCLLFLAIDLMLFSDLTCFYNRFFFSQSHFS